MNLGKYFPLGHNKNNQQQKRAIHESNKKKNKLDAPHVGPLLFFKIMLGIHPKSDKLNSDRNASAGTLRERKEVAGYRSALKFPATMLSNNAVTDYYRMGFRYQRVQHITNERFFLTIFIDILPLVAMLIVKNKSICILLMAILPILTWLLMGMILKESYNKWAVKQAYMFDIIMTIIAPYLYKMNSTNASSRNGANGTAINEIIYTVSHRVDDKSSRDALSTLGIDIQHHPDDFWPYAKFARKFSTAPTPYMFMHSVYNLAQGSSDVSAIRALVIDIMDDLLEQIRKIERAKLRRFFVPPIVLFLDWFYVVVTYFVIYMMQLLKKTMHGIHI